MMIKIYTHGMKDVTNYLPQHTNTGMRHGTGTFSQNCNIYTIC